MPASMPFWNVREQQKGFRLEGVSCWGEGEPDDQSSHEMSVEEPQALQKHWEPIRRQLLLQEATQEPWC